eukprot:1158906-Pelagomonas_calceolata.AAC.2
MAGLYARLARLFKSVLEACSLGVSEVFVLYGFRANAGGAACVPVCVCVCVCERERERWTGNQSRFRI